MKAVDPTVCDSVSDCAVKREPEKKIYKTNILTNVKHVIIIQSSVKRAYRFWR